MAPIITALIETIVDVAKQRAARSPSRRLSPPLGLFLDECANIAPLPSLPQLVSDGAGQGITTTVVLQSLSQARARWGVDETAGLWDACTVKVVLGGLADGRDLEMISRMCGEVDVETAGRSYGADGAVTRSVSRRRIPVLTPGQVRTLPRWHGLVLYEELRAVEAALPGWWELRQFRSGGVPCEPFRMTRSSKPTRVQPPQTRTRHKDARDTHDRETHRGQAQCGEHRERKTSAIPAP